MVSTSVCYGKNVIKTIEVKKQEIILPKSAKLVKCQDISKEYGIILSDHCTVIKDFFNSVTKD